MNYFCATIYGIIQGLTEFLPVSSSGHLALLPYLLEIKDPGVAFDLAMHLGTALAIILYFHKDILVLVRDGFSIVFGKSKPTDLPFAFNFIVATIATAFTALPLKAVAETYGRGDLLIAFNLFFFGLILVYADRTKEEVDNKQMSTKVSLKQSIAIGLFQSLALFPGVSRSGITITVGRFFNLTREEASRFSFLLSLPLIIGGALLKMPDLANGGQENVLVISLFGILISFIVGILTIHFFLKFIKKVGLECFGIYRVILAALIVYFHFY